VRIWHQGFVELESVPLYVTALEVHARAVASPGTTVDLHGLRPGTYTPHSTAAALARDPALRPLGVAQVVTNVARAEREGYDAAAITIVQDLGLREARALVRIPVAGYGESAMRAAYDAAAHFAVVAFDPDIAEQIADEIDVLGLRDRALSVELVDTDYGGVLEAFERPERLARAFAAAARRAVARGAGAIVPGQTIMAEALWQHGLREIDGAPVIDALGTTIGAAERMVRSG
jgi:allantoin racemase